jgi:Leucine-rich repeat (LRR) protein
MTDANNEAITRITVFLSGTSTQLNLSAIRLTDKLLKEAFSSVTIQSIVQHGITKLDLSKNRLTTLPASIGNLTQLKTLDISENPLRTDADREKEKNENI